MSKPTVATLKSFIAKNRSNLFIEQKSHFDGMCDGVVYDVNAGFKPARKSASHMKNTLGIEGAWVVGRGRDLISSFEADGFKGYDVCNCTGSFVLAVRA
jgi:hypothetical protein